MGKLDITGRVPASPNAPHAANWWGWTDLKPFTRGVLGRALEELNGFLAGFPGEAPQAVGFSSLSTEALELAVADTVKAAAEMQCEVDALTEDDGRRFWEHRAEGFPGPNELDDALAEAFPTLTVVLEDDGKVAFRG